MSAAPLKSAIAAVAALLVLAAGAAAAKYEGAVDDDPEAIVTLEVERSDGGRTVTGFKVKGLLIHCSNAGDARLPHLALDGEAAAGKRGRFELEAREHGLRVAVKGRLIGRLEAKGTLSYAGRTTVGEEELECASGKQKWAVAR